LRRPTKEVKRNQKKKKNYKEQQEGAGLQKSTHHTNLQDKGKRNADKGSTERRTYKITLIKTRRRILKKMKKKYADKANADQQKIPKAKEEEVGP
jgi:hypothetical protein